MLHDRLVSSGWRDELKEHCKEVIRRKGLEKVTVEELVAEITPKGRCTFVIFIEHYFIIFLIYSLSPVLHPFSFHSSATVPEDIKADLLQRIRKFLQATS